jgi:hypothetical protein
MELPPITLKFDIGEIKKRSVLQVEAARILRFSVKERPDDLVLRTWQLICDPHHLILLTHTNRIYKPRRHLGELDRMLLLL